MNFDQALLNVRGKTLEPIYFLYGKERFYQTEILRAIERKLITPDNRDFNLETFEAKTSSLQDWLGATQTLSFLGGTKLVIVRNLDQASLPAKEAEPLLDYLADPAPDICLVLTADQADRKKNIFKALTKIAGAVHLEAPSEGQLALWIKKRAQGLGYTLSGEAARLIVERIGQKPGILATELDKVLTYAGENSNVTEKDVAKVVGAIRMENVFALTEALKEKNTEKALALLRNQLEHGEEPVKILGMVAWQLRTIWEVKSYQDKKIPAGKIAQEMGAKPFMIEKAMRHTKNFSVAQLKRGFENLFQADRELKTTGKDPEGVLETLVLRLCSG